MDLILSATGRPFSDKTAAQIKAADLTTEVGDDFTVVDHPDGGYALARQRRARESLALSIGPVGAPGFPTIKLRPAGRSFWYWHLLWGKGLLLALAPRQELTWLFTQANKDYGPRYAEYLISMGLMPWLVLGGSLMVLTAILKMANGYYSNRYELGPYVIETSKGWGTRDNKRVEYRHIRSVSVKQNFVELILNIGLVEVSTAARERGDVTFVGVSRPRLIQNEIERRMASLTRNGWRGPDE